MRISTWIVLTAVLLGGAAKAQALHALPYIPGSWRTKPSGSDIAAVYPAQAQNARKGGWAVIECQTEPTGGLKNCQVLGEAPTGYGFGEASLKLMRRFELDTKKVTPAQLAGGVVTVPIVMTTEGGEPPLQDLFAGEPSVLLTPSASGKIPCPTTAAPKQTCAPHRLAWAVKPTLPETAALIRSAAASPALTNVLCQVGEDNRLTRCALAGQADPSQISAMNGLLPLFTAPVEANDKTPTREGFILVQFAWPTLKRVVETSVLTQAP